MRTQDIEAAAHAMWHHEGLRAGTPSIAAKRTPEAFAQEDESTRSKWLGLAKAALSSRIAAPVAVVKPLYEFDRYINGQLMAEGVTIERQTDLASACSEAARIASQGPNGEAPVLVLSAITIQPAAQVQAEAVAGAMRAAYEGLFKHANGTTVLGGQSYRSLTLEVAAELLISITPKEAFASLETVASEAHEAGRKEGLREAADKVLDRQGRKVLGTTESNAAYDSAMSDAYHAILALIDKEPAND